MRHLKERIKAAWKVLTDKHNFACFFTDYKCYEYERTPFDVSVFIKRAAYEFYGGKSTTESDLARREMISSILSDPSVVLLSKHCGENTVIYDCASEEDFQDLKSQEIE